MGSSRSKRARKDLRFYGPNNRVVLTGEVKMPGNTNAFDANVVKDAGDKAEEANTQYFFTWDVNTFVLWDRSLWQKPLLDRRVKVWPLRLNLASPQDVARAESLDFIEKRFLPDLISDLSDIVSGHRRDWAIPPDEVFLHSLESHLNWPVMLLRQYMHSKAEPKSAFDRRLQDWLLSQDRVFLRNQPEEWRNALDNAARTLAYIWTNRFIFYKALRARFPELPKLELSPSIKAPNQALRRLNDLFKKAAERSGDYETLLFPEAHDWANELLFEPAGSIDAWRGFLRSIESVDFRDVPADIVGLIFQKLISPEERHRFGQHFTGHDPVDLINSFCIRKADAAVLDPACGSGSFLVRAYYRKRAMNARRSHLSMLGDLFGCDIALYPAHLATLNLAAREINDEANYPRIDRRDFFDYKPGEPFCLIPEHGTGQRRPIMLPQLDAVVGNPPYVSQGKIDKVRKARLPYLVNAAFSGTELSGRSDLHCYFWLHASQFLKEGGVFGFLTSDPWLDTDYGFALQRWILKHFKIIAIMESATERWFPDARVKTCITILERCGDEAKRRDNTVRFVRFEKPLAEIIGVEATGGVGEESEEGEQLRQTAVDHVRDAIERTTRKVHDDRWRILVKRQGDLWDEGVLAGGILKGALVGERGEDEDDNGEDFEEIANGNDLILHLPSEYVAGKWGRYLRAPDLHFEIMERFKDRFVPLGEIVEIRRGITSGCDAFFMAKDVAKCVLEENKNPKEFRKLVGVARSAVEDGTLAVIEDGAGTLHPIEPEFIAPEVHSLMKVDRPLVRAKDLDRVVLLVPGPLSAIKGTHAYRYVKYGEQATFASNKSKAVPVPQRPSCAGRDPWYDLTKLVDPGFAFWPKSQQYRHIIPANPHSIICNCNLYDLAARDLTRKQQQVLVGVLNSTMLALFKTFYGRFAGTEGNLKTEVVDVNLIDVPDPRKAANKVAKRLIRALSQMQKRQVTGMIEEALMDCHSYGRAMELASRPVVLARELQQPDRRELDDAVFELLGVSDAAERAALIDRLYEETALHFRAIRVTEIQKMEDRAKGGQSKFAVADHAADAWDALDLTDLTPLAEWVKANAAGECEEIEIPSERPVHLPESDLFDSLAVYFGGKRHHHVVCNSHGQAELLARMAELGVTGSVQIPTDEARAKDLLEKINKRHELAAQRLRELAASRSGNTEMQEEVFNLLERWFVVGKPSSNQNGRR